MRTSAVWFSVFIFLGLIPSCGSSGQDGGAGGPGKITDLFWQWESFSGPDGQLEVEAPAQYGITFNENGTISVKADCNRATGEYSIEGEKLNISIGPSTLAYCPAESRSDQFLELLGRAAGHSVDVSGLKVVLSDGAEMLFSAAEGEASEAQAPAPAGEQGNELLNSGLLGQWEWVSFQGMDDSSLEVSDPSRYTLEIRTDGVSVLADCNRGMGGFESDGASLSFSEIATTRMACPPDSLADLYLSHLSYVRSWLIKDGDLYLSLFADGGIMRFRPAGE